MSGLVDACHMFVNQAVFDGLSGIKASLPMSFSQVARLVYIHGFSELSRSSGDRELTTMLAAAGIRVLLKKGYSAQKYLCDTAEMFIERIIALSDKISDKEREILAGYRSKIIPPAQRNSTQTVVMPCIQNCGECAGTHGI